MRIVSLRVLAATVALAPMSLAATAAAHPHEHERTTGDIVQTAQQAGQFDILLAAVGAAHLTDALRSDGPLTVFAPLDSAFARLPDGEVERLLKPENRHELRNILTLHVAEGAITSDDLSGRIIPLETLGGQTVLVDATDGVRVGNAHVVQADIRTDNGVIHVIDRVILPTG